MSATDLLARAEEFAELINGLLNATVTTEARLTAAVEDPWVYVAQGMADEARLESIPLLPPETGATSGYEVSLRVSYRMSLDDLENKYLTVQHSRYGLWLASPSGKSRPAVRIDFDREKRSYTKAYVHVHGHSSELDLIRAWRGQEFRSLAEYHFPVGGQRYRPCIEDFIEFLFDEGLAEPVAPGWEAVLERSRDAYHRIQLMAAVRRDQHAAADALAKLGWIVTSSSVSARHC